VVPSSGLSPVIDLHLRGYALTHEVTEQGFERLKLYGDAVIHLRFEGISDVRIEGFNTQNVLSSMRLEVVASSQDPERKMLKVALEHCYQFEASFAAQTARVLSITPYVR
jgi:hypothetical protein